MKYIFCLLITLMSVISWSQEKLDNELAKNIDKYINNIQKENGIPGITLAIIQDGEVIYKNNIGYANIEHQVPVSDKSIFRLYSLTKPIVSVGVFQLIEEGKLHLNDSVSKYISGLLKNWDKIQIKHLLSHSSGLPDMSPIPDFQDLSEKEAKTKVFKRELKFDSGEKYDYNQTGFWLLQKVIEKVSDTDLTSFIIQNQFKNTVNTFFSSDSRDIILNRATPYFPFAKGKLMIDHSYLQGSYAFALNGLNITLEDFISWDKSLRENKFITSLSKKEMWQLYNYKNPDKFFSYGWGVYPFRGSFSYGFSGSFCTAYRIFPDLDLSIIFLSNGLSKFYSIDNTILEIAEIVLKN